jgi:hypothetical protein
MKKILIITALVLAALLGARSWFRAAMTRNFTDCVKARGESAIEACGWVMKYTRTPVGQFSAHFMRSAHHEAAGRYAEAAADMEHALRLVGEGKFSPREDELLRAYEGAALNHHRLGNSAQAFEYSALAAAGGSRDATVLRLSASGGSAAGRRK